MTINVGDLYARHIDEKPRNKDWSEGLNLDVFADDAPDGSWEFWDGEQFTLDAADFNAEDVQCWNCGEDIKIFSDGKLHHVTFDTEDDTVLFVIDPVRDEQCDAELDIEDLETEGFFLQDVDADGVNFILVGGAGKELEVFGTDFRLESEGPMMNYWYPLDIDDMSEAAKLLTEHHLPMCVVQIDGDETGIALTGGGMDLSWEICEAYVRLGFLPPVHFSDLPAMADKKLNERTTLILDAMDRSLAVMGESVRRGQSRLATLRRSLADA